MTLQATASVVNPLTLREIAGEHGNDGTIALSDYVRGGSLVANITQNQAVSLSASSLTILQFLGTTNFDLGFSHASYARQHTTYRPPTDVYEVAFSSLSAHANSRIITSDTDGNNTNAGYWGNPEISAVGGSYEVKLNITELFGTGHWGYSIFGVSTGYSNGSTTPYYTISAERQLLISAGGTGGLGGGYSRLIGTLYIRHLNTTTPEITATISLEAQNI